MKNHTCRLHQSLLFQKYPCESLDVNDVNLRLEIVQLKELRHNNLIHFIGACLDYPNVGILTEPCPKVRNM